MKCHIRLFIWVFTVCQSTHLGVTKTNGFKKDWLYTIYVPKSHVYYSVPRDIFAVKTNSEDPNEMLHVVAYISSWPSLLANKSVKIC